MFGPGSYGIIAGCHERGIPPRANDSRSRWPFSRFAYSNDWPPRAYTVEVRQRSVGVFLKGLYSSLSSSHESN